MSFYSKLREKLKNKLKEKELKNLPRSYFILGNILLIKLKSNLLKHKKLIGKEILKLYPYIHTVALEREIKKQKRKPKIEIIAGCKRTQTLHTEYGCKFLIDISELMWSKGNKNERIRITKLVKPNEIIVDMFGGCGYFSIFLARLTPAKKIYAIDLNPKAIEYLRKNAWMNQVEDKIEILQGDNRKFSKYLENTADRIVMGYIKNTEKFLPSALRIAKNNCVIHLHNTIPENKIEDLKKRVIEIGKKSKCDIKIISFRKVKSYAPRVWHIVFDLKIKHK